MHLRYGSLIRPNRPPTNLTLNKLVFNVGILQIGYNHVHSTVSKLLLGTETFLKFDFKIEEEILSTLAGLISIFQNMLIDS